MKKGQQGEKNSKISFSFVFLFQKNLEVLRVSLFPLRRLSAAAKKLSKASTTLFPNQHFCLPALSMRLLRN